MITLNNCFVTLFSRIMALSKKLTAMDELLSCDPLYLAKVSISFPFLKTLYRLAFGVIDSLTDHVFVFRSGGRDRNLILMTLIPFHRSSIFKAR